MNINLTLFGEMITFAIFVWFTMRFVWPPLMKALTERREKIAAGLAAAERSQRDLELAAHKVTELLTQAKAKIDIAREFQIAREKLLQEISSLVITGAEKVLQHEINKSANDRIVSEMINTL